MNEKPDYGKAKEIAEFLIQRLEIIRPIINTRYVADALGIKVIDRQLDHCISGHVNFNKELIAINKLDHPYRHLFTIAHGIGHFLLHKDYCKEHPKEILYRNHLSKLDHREQEANIFASHLLIPEDWLISYLDDDTPIEEISRIFGCSLEIIKYRIKCHKNFT